MFLSVKNCRKEDLIFVATEIGENVQPTAKICDLKEIILKSDEYKTDPDFVKEVLENAVTERKLQEVEKLELEKIKLKEKQNHEFELERIKLTNEKELELEKLKVNSELEKLKVNSELEMARMQTQTQSQDVIFQQIPETSHAKKKFTLPKLQFRQFGDDLKDWLPFWSQFEHIHKDDDIAPENKFQYLAQATVVGSRAREVVESFPPTGENYAKAVDSLKARFGREDLLVEVYVRELLKLIMSVQSKQKLSPIFLYDKLESYLRALETLGVTTEKCASILYPMVESCFDEEFLKAWNRSAASSSGNDAKERLENLMQFLKGEVEGDERISLAMAGFGLCSDENRQSFKKKGRDFQIKKVPTAANLLTTASKDRRKECVFFTGKHSSSDCFSAQKMSLAERQSILKDKQCCFACLTPRHTARKCKMFLKCVVCGKKHVPLMCETLDARNRPSDKSDEICTNAEVNMSNNTYSPKVFLQTLKIKLVSDCKEISVRAILDSGSKKTYVLKNLVEKMGYIPVKKETLLHSLFGGIKSDKCEHTCYRIKLRNPENNLTCNMEALDQSSICDNITSVSPGLWIKELRKMNITLSDVSNDAQPVQVLLGADVIGKLMTGQRKVLTCGLVAIETLLGWTLSGKVPDSEAPPCNAMLVTSLLVNELDISQMWRLDSLGIQDPSEQKTKEELHKASMEHFLSTVKIDENKRFLVSLP